MASIDELWTVDFGSPLPDEPAGMRPALIVGPPPIFGESVPYIIVCPLTTTHRSLSLHVEVEATELTGLATTSYVQCELVRSVGRRRLVHRLGVADTAARRQVDTILRTLLDH